MVPLAATAMTASAGPKIMLFLTRGGVLDLILRPLYHPIILHRRRRSAITGVRAASRGRHQFGTIHREAPDVPAPAYTRRLF